MSQGNYVSLLRQKLSLLFKVYENTRLDEGSIEECLKAVETNERHFTELLKIESNLENVIPEVSLETSGILEEINSLLLKASESTSRLVKIIQYERNIAAKAIEQFSKRRDVANSYIKLDQRSVFVDKDFK
jgi:hypothetical protein